MNTLSLLIRGRNKAKLELKKLLLRGHDPSFMVIGAQRAGTTSLAYYLGQHPQLNLSLRKELHYFDSNRYTPALKGYRKNFLAPAGKTDKQFFFEATPSYIRSRETLERIRRHYPDMRFVLILRDPIKRAFSEWNMYNDMAPEWRYNDKVVPPHPVFADFKETGIFPDFETCIREEVKLILNNEQDDIKFVQKGFYADQLSVFKTVFSMDQLLILGNKELVAPTEALNRILSHIGLPPSDWSFLNAERKNLRNYTAKISAETQETLEALYRPHNEKLFEMLGYVPKW